MHFYYSKRVSEGQTVTPVIGSEFDNPCGDNRVTSEHVLQLHTLSLGAWQTNCYVLADDGEWDFT